VCRVFNVRIVKNLYLNYSALDPNETWQASSQWQLKTTPVSILCGRFKVVKYIEMPKAAPQKSICHSQKLEMILIWN